MLIVGIWQYLRVSIVNMGGVSVLAIYVVSFADSESVFKLLSKVYLFDLF